MNKFKIPALIFASVFVISAIALLIFIKEDVSHDPDMKVDAPAWIHEEGSSGKQPISGKVAKSGNMKIRPAVNASESNATLLAAKNQTPKNGAAKKTNDTIKKSAIAKTIDKIQKTIITEVFLENLAKYIADNYQPAGSLPHKPEKGFSSASFKSINTYFGLNLHGLMPEALSLVSARKSIWAEFLSPGTLNMLYETDSADLLDLVEEQGILAERKFAMQGDTFELRELTRKQRAEMFRVSAVPLRHVSAVLTSLAENRDLLQAMDSYIRAEKRVDIANGVFQADLDQSRNSNSVTAKNKATHSGKVLKDAITVREKIKTGITDKIKAFCSGPCEKPDDSFYIAKWVFRRTKDNEKRIESILSGCKILNNLAVQMEKRAVLIENKI